ncbi:16S rRNA (guanine(527)-N(7))-methyltransferase RsmG [Raineyella sp. LH-20]|uniref:16S rRNA (guanine(527)-N(7))-methyltransferase RsmG n=1 Tax=Raineyella sp. LH-20 TaxID=3081204 RepID=UPI00295530B8|nr:16S rRNA (guanine(527)-N(7))-methyltransferase RsmG [Raineyella sp. LH-20]WOP19592.1 16S rRNA (guanine(527)-N(7))-methyltransferase RsmG [Raineyella sp. LH-20]
MSDTTPPGEAQVEIPDPDVVRAVFGSEEPVIRAYAHILATRGIEWGLIGPRETPRLWARHLFNCAALLELLPTGCTVADVGSGAGLPGLVVAIGRPDVRVSLIEPLQRRVNFLEQAVSDLGLEERVEVLRGRAEEFDPGVGFDVVTSRAVGALTKLIGWCLPLVRVGGADGGGQILALKGASAGAEIEKAAKELRKARLTAEILSVRADPRAEPTSVVRLRTIRQERF